MAEVLLFKKDEEAKFAAELAAVQHPPQPSYTC